MGVIAFFARYAPLGSIALILASTAGAQPQSARREYPGFDRNDYPGDAVLPALHKNFRYSVFWLNNPPGEQSNSWTDKRAILKKNGFGFLILFNGRADADLKNKDSVALGTADGKAAAAAAKREGFPSDILIFLDQEEGGRLLQEQADYLFAWADAVETAGARAGVYCSAIEVTDSSGRISTANDIITRENARTKNSTNGSPEHAKLKLWVADDQCPPSPGCTLTHSPSVMTLSPDLAGSVLVWQYAQSPRRTQFTAACPANYSAGKCYAPGIPSGPNSFVDLDTSESSDPSEERGK